MDYIYTKRPEQKSDYWHLLICLDGEPRETSLCESA